MAVTADISVSAGGVYDRRIWYDDATRAVATVAQGTGFELVTVQISAGVTRTVAYAQPGTVTQNADLAARMAAADFHIAPDVPALPGFPDIPSLTVTVLASNVPANQVSRFVGKAGAVVGGLPSSGEWRAS